MSYQKSILRRWSRRDKLAVLVVAVTITFLTGTTLVFAATSSQMTTTAREFDAGGWATYYDSMSAAQVDASDDAVVFPVARVTLPNGTTRTIIGVPRRTADTLTDRADVTYPEPPPSGTIVGSNGATADLQRSSSHVRLRGRADSANPKFVTSSSDDSVFPHEWYVANPSLVNRLGPTGGFLIEPPRASVPNRGVPLRAALAFFVAGTRQLLRIFSLVALCGTVLVGVTVFSVTRMSVRDRIRTIRVLRSTGCEPRRLVELFALRAGLVSGVGVALGFSLGVIVPYVALNVAVFVGLPTSLSIGVTSETLGFLLPLYAGTLLTGLLAGVLAVWPTVGLPPSRVTNDESRSNPESEADSITDHASALGKPFQLNVLHWRALVPSVATILVFSIIVLLVTSFVGTLGPIFTAEGTTVTEPGATHPVASKLPTKYADALRARGIQASPEILLFTARNGDPIVARGANYSAFASVSNASLVTGRPPRTDSEAVIGEDLAKTSGQGVGDTITLGGSTEPGIERVTIVGVYSAPSVYDDQALLSLPAARHLSTVSNGSVNIVRTAKQLRADEPGSSVGVLNVDAPDRIVAGSDVPVTVSIRNFGSRQSEHTVTVRLGNATETRTVSLGPNERRTKTVRMPAPPPGMATLRVAGMTQSILVSSRNAIRIDGLPEYAPPNSEPQVNVTTPNGSPAVNATLDVGNMTVRTGPDGTARVPFRSPGTYTVHVRYDDRTRIETVHVSRDVRRNVTATVQTQPENPSFLSKTTARVRLYNPWNRTLTRRIGLSGDADVPPKPRSVQPGTTTVSTYRIGQQSPGEHTVRVVSNDNMVASRTYSVSGDERLLSAYSSSGRRTNGTGIGEGIQRLFGDLNALLGILILLAAIMTVGATSAVFAQATHARRRTIGVYRATGASPNRIFRLVLRDTAVVGAVAVGIAVVIGVAVVSVLAALDVLVVYGVRVSGPVSPLVVVGCFVSGVAIVLLSAAMVTATMVRQQPNGLLSDTSRVPPSDTPRGDRFE